MSGDSGVLVVTRVLSTTTSAHEAAGAAGIRHSPRPFVGRKINAKLGRIAPRDREVVSGIVLLFENFEVGVCAKRSLTSPLLDLARRNAPVMPGLDPGIHLRHKFFFEVGSPGHLARRRAEPVIGPRFARNRWRFRPVMTISIGMTAPQWRR